MSADLKAVEVLQLRALSEMAEAATAHVAGLDLVTVFGQDAFAGLPEATQAAMADRWAVLARNLEDERSAFERELVSKGNRNVQII